MARIDASKLTLAEKVVQINRVAKVVKGGRILGFAALPVVGAGDGGIGMALIEALGRPGGQRGAHRSDGERNHDPKQRHREQATTGHGDFIPEQ